MKRMIVLVLAASCVACGREVTAPEWCPVGQVMGSDSTAVGVVLADVYIPCKD